MTHHLALHARRIRVGAAALLGILLAFLAPLTALAHPLGNFTINRYSRLELGADQVRVRYVIDMAEIPAFQERARIDLDHDETISAAEQDRYLSEEATALQSNLHLTINAEALTLQPQEPQLEFLPGQGGLQTMRLSMWFVAKLPQQGMWQAAYRDDNFAGRLGWQEVVVKAGPGVNLLDSNVPLQDVSNELRSYPQDLLQSPLAVSSAQWRFAPLSAGSVASAPQLNLAAATGVQSIDGRTPDRFTELIAMPDLNAGPVALAVLIAFIWGAAHAFSPGHGKTIVAAYLVGSRSTTQHAVFLGATTTITHTAGVFALGLLTLLASRYIVPEQLFPWLETISGVLVMSIGLSLFVRRLRHASASNHTHHDADHQHDHAYDHSHNHGDAHDHSHDHLHDHDHQHGGHTHTHLPPGADGAPVTWRGLLALGISGGLLPCPSALVVMLGAIALNRVGFGLLLIIVFSLGLAGTLTAIGLLMVRAKTILAHLDTRDRLFGRIPLNRRVIQVLPAVSALFIVLAGIGITLTALAQAGVFRA